MHSFVAQVSSDSQPQWRCPFFLVALMSSTILSIIELAAFCDFEANSGGILVLWHCMWSRRRHGDHYCLMMGKYCRATQPQICRSNGKWVVLRSREMAPNLCVTSGAFCKQFKSSKLKPHSCSFCSNCNSNDSIRSQFCTCHDSSHVLTCARMWTNRIIVLSIILIRATHIFTRFRYLAHKLVLKRVPGLIEWRTRTVIVIIDMQLWQLFRAIFTLVACELRPLHASQRLWCVQHQSNLGGCHLVNPLHARLLLLCNS